MENTKLIFLPKKVLFSKRSSQTKHHSPSWKIVAGSLKTTTYWCYISFLKSKMLIKRVNMTIWINQTHVQMIHKKITGLGDLTKDLF